MIKKIGLTLLLLSMTVTMPMTGWAASSKTEIKVSKSALDYEMVRPQSDGAFHDGLLLAQQSNGKNVYYNSKGAQAFTLPTGIEPLTDFREQRAVVKDTATKLYGYINTQGRLVIPCQYVEVDSFAEGTAHVKDASDREFFVDRAGKTLVSLTTSYDSDFLFTEGLATAYEELTGRIGYVNTKGELAIPYQYSYARNFSEGLAVVSNDAGLYGYIDSSGKQVIPFRYTSAGDFGEGVAPVQNATGKWGYINKQGKTVIPHQYANAWGFSEGLAVVYNTKEQVGYINKAGKLVIGYQKYNRADDFSQGIALVGINSKSDPNGKYGYIDRQGKLLTKLEYTPESSSFNQGYAVAVKNGKGYILARSTSTGTGSGTTAGK
ncbi:WG repeat-containing protein [Paenibacillus macerans]|uniref:WG repeat-containing protein n=1 Tax=Paenibacillus macerans TaxID=44252 RepID=UPI002040DA5C|nr:WG repeat-containing protein [Paenibacillus macerans]MCM3702230.1 WG repeat-containing protein [Paenibacillus macerans]